MPKTRVIRVEVPSLLWDRLDKVCEGHAFGYKSHILRRAIMAVVMQEEALREKSERTRRDREFDNLAGFESEV